jgi:N-acetylglucosaminyl-diphospho-decaprenol L-rhamnosyltransferase
MIGANRIPIIIVSYRNPADVLECFEALQNLADDPAFDIYICENGGRFAFDALISALTDEGGPCEQSEGSGKREPFLRLVRVESLWLRGRKVAVTIAEAAENLGYGGAINAWLHVLLTESGWPGAWILNPDTRPEPQALAELVLCAAQRQKGMVGSRIVSFNQPEIIGSRGLRWSRLRTLTIAVDQGAPSAVEPDLEAIEARLDAPSGTSTYITRDCLDHIGLVDERYFLFMEDLEWGYRAKQSCGVGYAHRSVVRHRKGTTTGSGIAGSPLTRYLEIRNALTFVRQYHPAWVAWSVAVTLLRTLKRGMTGGLISWWSAISGLKAGIAAEVGRPDRVFDFEGGTPRWRGKRPSLFRTPDGERGAGTSAAKRNTKIVISLIYHVGTSLVRGLRQVVGYPVQHRLIILNYHGVPSPLRVNFGRQLEMLSAYARVVPADYQGAAVRGGRSIAVTFDDALKSTVDNAIPELCARSLPSTIFVPTELLGAPPTWNHEGGIDYGADSVASAEALRSLPSDLVQLGAHTLTHPHLPQLRREDARREIAECRERIREIFGTNARLFAFPYGEHDAATVELCRGAGYDRVFTIIPRSVDPASDQFERGRIIVDPADGRLEFYLKMSGAYGWMTYLFALKQWCRRRMI